MKRNINGSINDLIVQILSRYKTIFSKDPTYREPTKVILKSWDDLILFGEDLIKDVLTDSAQVHVIIEAYKEAPKLEEIYADLCKSSNESCVIYSNIKKLLKNSESTFNLELSEILFEHREINKQFDIIINSIQAFSKQNLNSPMNYLTSLIKVDFSSNYLTDQIVCNIIENFVSKCQTLKIVNFSKNLMTLKSFKMLSEINKQNLTVLVIFLYTILLIVNESS